MPPVVAALGSIGSAIGGAIGGITGAIGGITGAIGSTAIGQAALQIGASLALSAIADALSPRGGAGGAVGQLELRSRTLSARVPVSPRELVYGATRKGGVIVFLHSTGDRSQHLHIVVVVAAHQIQSIGTIYFDGVPAVDGSGNALGRWAGFVDTVEKALGTQTANPFPALSAQTGGLWTSAHILRGCAAISMRLTFDPDAFPTGIPAISFDIQGKNDILDPRTATRGYSTNAALCVADYMSLTTYGIGAQIGSDTGIDSLSLIAAANICDESVAIIGGTESRYTCNGVISLSASPRTIIQSMLTAMAGQVVYRGGRWYVLAGAYRAPSVAFTPSDFDEKSFSLQSRISMRQNFNGVRGQFISPVNDWQTDDFPAYQSATYVAEDAGEERWLDISLPFTTSAAMAQRLAKIALEKNRRQMTVSFSGKLPLYRATAGDTANFNFPAWGIVDKPFDVQSVQFSGDGADGARLQVVLRETSPLVYSWEASEEQIYGAAPRTTLPSAFDIAPPINLQIGEELYVSSNNLGVRTRALLTWGPSPSINAVEYQAEIRPVGASDWQQVAVTPGLFAQIDDIAAGAYDFRVRARSGLGVTSAFITTRRIIVGLTADPVALENVTIQTAGGLAILKWQQSPDLDVRFGGAVVIRHTTSVPATWQHSYFMDEVAGASTIAVVPLKPGTYLVRPRDSTGRFGPAALLTATGAQALAFAPINSLVADPVFSGTKTGVQIVDGDLTLVAGDNVDDWPDVDAIENIDFPGPVSTSGAYQFAAGLDFGTVSLVRIRSEIRFLVSNVLELWDSRLGNIDDWQDIDGTTGAECDVRIEIRGTNDDPNASPVWGPWARLDSSEIEVRAIQARAILSTQDPAFAPLVDRLRVFADEVA